VLRLLLFGDCSIFYPCYFSEMHLHLRLVGWPKLQLERVQGFACVGDYCIGHNFLQLGHSHTLGLGVDALHPSFRKTKWVLVLVWFKEVLQMGLSHIGSSWQVHYAYEFKIYVNSRELERSTFQFIWFSLVSISRVWVLICKGWKGHFSQLYLTFEKNFKNM
jgi:hypothetical protein